MQKPKWVKAPPENVKYISEKMAYFECEKRSMFGYPCFFVNRNMFAGLFGGSAFIRLGEEDRGKLAEEKGVKPFEPVKGRVMKEYLEFPVALLKKEAWFKKWMVRSFQYALHLPPKNRKIQLKTKNI